MAARLDSRSGAARLVVAARLVDLRRRLGGRQELARNTWLLFRSGCCGNTAAACAGAKIGHVAELKSRARFNFLSVELLCCAAAATRCSRQVAINERCEVRGGGATLAAAAPRGRIVILAAPPRQLPVMIVAAAQVARCVRGAAAVSAQPTRRQKAAGHCD